MSAHKDEGSDKEEEEKKSDSASRARNKTVMLTAEMTGRVREMLTRSSDAEPAEEEAQDPVSNLLPDEEASAEQPAVDESAQGNEFLNKVFGSGSSPDETVIAGAAKPPQKPTGEFKREDLMKGQESAPKKAPAAKSEPAKPAAKKPSAAESAGARAAAAQKVISQRGGAGAGNMSAVAVSRAGNNKIVGFLVSYDEDPHGEVYEICAGRWLLTSRPTDHGEFILIEHETISPLHAIIRATRDGKVQVLDQLSEFGTGVVAAGTDEEKDIAGAMVTVNHGDRVRFGERNFVLCLVPQHRRGKDKKSERKENKATH